MIAAERLTVFPVQEGRLAARSLESALMNWTLPIYSRRQVNAAGSALVSGLEPEEAELDGALAIVDNWRMAHHYPLQIIKMNLWKWAKRVDADALVYQRIKRLSSIESKLRRFPAMKLSQMQDIGGCRAVVSDAPMVAALARLYEERELQRPDEGSQCVEVYDYIAAPKEDGYRSLHLVYKYGTKPSRWQARFRNLRIEVQIRSRLQHAWASAVETVDTFTRQALKSNVGSDEWKRFFALMGSDIAMRERRPLVPGTPTTRAELRGAIAGLTQELRVEMALEGWNLAVQNIDVRDARLFLLILDFEEKTVRVKGYRARERQIAERDLSLVEKEAPTINAVLVKAESVQALRRAFPSYYLDAAVFMGAVRRASGIAVVS